MPARSAKKATKPKPKGRGVGNTNLSTETTCKIITSFIVGEGSARTIAEKHGVCERTAESIKAKIPKHLCGINADDNAVLGQLLKLYLTEAITTCVAILQDLRSPEKLKKQSVQESLAVFGAFSDRIFLLVEAAERAAQSVNEQPRQLLEGAVS